MQSNPLQDIVEELTRHYPKGNLVVGVGVDGSQMSNRAVEVACTMIDKKRKDRLLLLHVSDPSKAYLPKHLQPLHLEHFYSDLAAQQHLESEWVCKAKEPGQSTCEALTGLADDNQTTLVVVGSFGRKGEKLDMLGTVSDFSLRESHSSICIVRSTGAVPTGHGTHYMFATDGSRAAAFAFVQLVKQICRPTDTVDVCLVSFDGGEQDERTIVIHKEFLATCQVSGHCFIRTIYGQMTVVDGILDAVKQHEADVLVLGISGYSKKKLGSVSEEITIRARCTTLVIKDPVEVNDGKYAHAGAKSLTNNIMPTKFKVQADQPGDDW